MDRSMENMNDLLNIYRIFVWNSVHWIKPMTDDDHLNRAILAWTGLAGEVGEVVEWHKKNYIHNKPQDPEALLLEMGDVLWYFMLMCAVHGVTFEEIILANMHKLMIRNDVNEEGLPNGETDT